MEASQSFRNGITPSSIYALTLQSYMEASQGRHQPLIPFGGKRLSCPVFLSPYGSIGGKETEGKQLERNFSPLSLQTAWGFPLGSLAFLLFLHLGEQLICRGDRQRGKLTWRMDKHKMGIFAPLYSWGFLELLSTKRQISNESAIYNKYWDLFLCLSPCVVRISPNWIQIPALVPTLNQGTLSLP